MFLDRAATLIAIVYIVSFNLNKWMLELITFLDMWNASTRQGSWCVAQFVVSGRRALGAVFPPFNKVLRPTSDGGIGSSW
jgi:hypothetical protein